jgi:hypothetical protein
VNKALLKFSEYPVSNEELAGLTEDQRAAFAVLCFAISELNFLSKMFRYSGHSDQEKDEIIAAWGIQSHILIRTISSKLFELREFFKFTGNNNRTSDPYLEKLRKRANEKFREIDKHEGLKLAKSIRHEASFHYRLGAAKKRLASVHGDCIKSLYLHELGVNSFYPYGEEDLFIGLINEIAGSVEDKAKAKRVIEAWGEWSRQSASAFNELLSEFVEELIVKRRPAKRPLEKMYWVEPSLVGEVEKTKLPAFVRIPKNV